MNNILAIKKSIRKSHSIKVDKNMKDHSKDPYFIKKAEDMDTIIKECGLPRGIEKK